MALLKSTTVLGNITAIENVVADKIIKNGGTADEILCADGSTKELSALSNLSSLTITVQEKGVEKNLTYNGTQAISFGSQGTPIWYAVNAGNAAVADSVAWSNVTSKPSFATVATSGNYNDLTNQPDIPVYSQATQSSDGLLSAADKTKLDSIDTEANNYTLPLAASGTRGGLQIGYSESKANLALKLSDEKGYVTVSKTAVTTALGYTPLTSTEIDTKISTAVSDIVNSAPETLNTLNELATALGNDPNFATTVSNNIGTKVTGISSSTNNAVMRFDGTGGKLVKNSVVTIDDSGSITIGGTWGGTSSANPYLSMGGYAKLTANSAGAFTFAPSNTPSFLATTTEFRPISDTAGKVDLGSSSYKFRNVYATTIYGDLSGNATTATTANTALAVSKTVVTDALGYTPLTSSEIDEKLEDYVTSTDLSTAISGVTDTKVTQDYNNDTTTGQTYPILMSSVVGTTSTDSRGAATATLINSIYAMPWSGGLSAVTLYEDAKPLRSKYLSLTGGQVTGDLELYHSSNGTTPRLVFRRGNYTDNYNDWSLQDTSGHLYIQQRGVDSTAWETRAIFTQTGAEFVGTIKENGTALSEKYQAIGDYLTSIPAATSDALGGIKTGYTTSGKNYKVQTDNSGNAYVNVPWTDNNTTYDVATTTTNGLMSYVDKSILNGIAQDYVTSAELNEKASSVNNPNLSYYALDNGSTTAGTWIASCDDVTALFDGLSVKYKITVAGASTTKFNLNNLGAKTVYLRGTTKLTTHYAVDTMINLIYNAETQAWYIADYDTTNGQFRHYYTLTTADGEYPLVYSYTTATGTSSYKSTYGAVKGGFTFNPSTDTLTVTNLNGNASSATVAESANSVAWANVSGKPDSYYTLPNATSSTLGGVKVGSNITVSSGTISLSKDNVTAALGYTPLSTAGGTLTGNVTLQATTNANGVRFTWGKVGSNTPYFGYASDQTDGTFVWSLRGTGYASGLAIGGGSTNLLWKGVRVATFDDLPSYSIATTSTAGLVKPISVTDTASLNTVTSTAGRYYQVEMNSSGNMFVNVPWVASTSSGAGSDMYVMQDYATNTSPVPLLMSSVSGISSTDSRGAATALVHNSLYAIPSVGALYSTYSYATEFYENNTALSSKYLGLAGGTLTGDLTVGKASIQTNGYVNSTWLKTTSATDFGSAVDYKGVAIIDNSGWVYYKSLDNIKVDLGITDHPTYSLIKSNSTSLKFYLYKDGAQFANVTLKPPTPTEIGITYGTTDLTAGTSELADGTFYFVYE